ncbi:MAG: adenylate/guanylate cyclase domain-containing protein [Myxococcota bacterium]
MAKLIVRLPDGREREYELAAMNTLGRHPQRSIQILDRLVSKKHATIRREDDGWILEDLGSLNGTWINDERVHGTVPLRHRDRLKMGGTHAVFQDELGAGTGQHEITIGDGLDSSICNAVDQITADEFLPVDMVGDVDTLRRDYEKLRIAARVQHEVAGEVRQEDLLPRLLDELFGLFRADRGVILLTVPGTRRLVPRAVKVRGRDEAESITLSRTIIHHVLDERQAVLTSDALHDARFAHAQSVILHGIRSSMCVPLLARNKEVMGVLHLDSQISTNAFTEKDLSMLQGIAQQASVAVENSRLVARIEDAARTRQKLEKMLSPHLVERVVSGEIEIRKGGEQRPASVLFTDIRGFTTLAERTDPEELVRMLNEYFELIVDVVFECEGTLDKFMGDGVMAVWGAPVEVDGAGASALRAAMQIQRGLRRFNDLRAMDGLPPVHTGIGVDTGEVIAGYMGSTKTMSYTVVGPVVNRASRLCAAAGPEEIIVSDTTWEAAAGTRVAGEGVRVEKRPGMRLKGITRPVDGWAVVDTGA